MYRKCLFNALKSRRNALPDKASAGCTNVLLLHQCRCITTRTMPTLKKAPNKIGLVGYSLLTIPAVTFCLGVWQIARKRQKEELVAHLQERTTKTPVDITECEHKLEQMEYMPVRVIGEYLHDQEQYIGPRSLIQTGNNASYSSLLSIQSSKYSNGFWVITPFRMSHNGEIILLNRGWVPRNRKNPKCRQEDQIDGQVEVVGIVRLNENRPIFLPKHTNGTDWTYRDLKSMSKVTESLPVMLDVIEGYTNGNGPIGGQTNVNLRNEHLSYILTWFSLSAATSFMWYKQVYIRP